MVLCLHNGRLGNLFWASPFTFTIYLWGKRMRMLGRLEEAGLVATTVKRTLAWESARLLHT